MFTVYVDDSGTSPTQKNAIASALVIPATRIPELDKEWSLLLDNEGCPSGLHCAELAANNSKSEFADWDFQKQSRVLRRARQIVKKYGVIAFSMAVQKDDYDEVVPDELRELGGRYHYTWGVRWVIGWLEAWAEKNGIASPFEYIFDWMGEDKKNPAKREIESVMAQGECMRPGRYAGHYAFRKRKVTPALQCADILAWSCYQCSLDVMFNKPPDNLAAESFSDFYQHQNGDWLLAVSVTKENLAKWAEKELNDPASQKRRREWRETGKITPGD